MAEVVKYTDLDEKHRWNEPQLLSAEGVFSAEQVNTIFRLGCIRQMLDTELDKADPDFKRVDYLRQAERLVSESNEMQ
jgi:hypothetical protein